MVGGGGLVQLPGLMILMPRESIPTIFGTNKLVSFTGTLVAATQYARRATSSPLVTVPAAVAAFACSVLGATSGQCTCLGSTGHVLYLVALPMAACNIAGSLIGVRLAVLKGNAFVRRLFLVVVTLMIARLTWDMW